MNNDDDLSYRQIDAARAFFDNARPVSVALRHPIGSLVIDAEEDFEWANPVRGAGYSTDSMRRVRDLQELVSVYDVRPTYLLTYPVLDDLEVVRILNRQLDRGECDVGVQLHAWVNPPFGDDLGEQASFAGNLAANIEEGKLVALKKRFLLRFGREPRVFRSGRYGLGKSTPRLIEKHGFAVDTSLAPRTNFTPQSGPDFSDFDCTPFWFGAADDLLELPLCRAVVGWAGPLVPRLYRALSTPLPERLHFPAVLGRMRVAERITLSPEGNDHAAMCRLLRHKFNHGQRVFSLSFHSSSLSVGHNPYVQTKSDLHIFYDRLSEILDTMRFKLNFRFATLAEIPTLLSDRRL